MNTLLKYTYAGAIIVGASCMVSCDDFLDTNPDNRATIDNEQKVENLLVGAYPDHDHIYVAELVSDNIDDYGEGNPETERFCEDTWAWKDEKEQDNESLESFWESSLVSISAANEVLKAIENLPTSSAMQEAKGEALMCRAYNYFMLANMFCMPYDKAKNDTQLGLPYLTEPETQLNPKYERGNMTDLYNHIQADIEEGLPLVNGSYYTVPKYHFTKRAAYALATRFYLFTEQWEKAIEAATLCLGDQPATMLRNWKSMSQMTQSFEAITNQYINADENANLLLLTSYSAGGLFFGPYRYNSRYSHGKYLAEHEDIRATQLWGGYTSFYVTPKAYGATNLDKTIFWKLPYIFEYTDPVVGWLICIAGPNIGRDYRIGAGTNSIGRDGSNRIAVFGDNSISRDKHCMVIYEPKKMQFFLKAGDSTGLTYLNEEYVTDMTPLKAGDVLEIGASKFYFFPLCGDKFKWENYLN